MTKQVSMLLNQECANLVSKYVHFDNANSEKLSKQQKFNALLLNTHLLQYLQLHKYIL